MTLQKWKTRKFGLFSPGKAPFLLHYSAHRWKFEKPNTFLDRQRPLLLIETTCENISKTHLESIEFSKI